MQKIVLVANQCKYVPFNPDYIYVGVDKGAFYCLNHNIPMAYAIGDFDSLNQEQYDLLKDKTKLISLPCRKNETDGEYAIRYAYNEGYRDIDVYGVIGGRLDHFITILNLLIHYDLSFRIIDEQNCIYTLNAGEYEIIKKSKYFSIFACEDVYITLEGVEYPLHNQFVSKKDIYLVSNEIIDVAKISVSGKVLIVESDDLKDVFN